MNIIINSQNKDMADGVKLADVVALFARRPEVVVAELNGAIVDRKLWADTALSEGDRVELVTFVGGG